MSKYSIPRNSGITRVRERWLDGRHIVTVDGFFSGRETACEFEVLYGAGPGYTLRWSPPHHAFPAVVAASVAGVISRAIEQILRDAGETRLGAVPAAG